MRLVTALCLLMTSVNAAQSGPLKFAIYGDWGVGPDFVPTDPTLTTATLKGIYKDAGLTVPQYGHLMSLTEQSVVSQFQNVSDAYQPQFILSTGDQFYDDGLFTRDDPQFQNKFSQVYTSPGVNVTWYPCLGNHDYYQDPNTELNRTMDDWRWYFPSKYYNFSYWLEDGSEVLFVVLDVTPGLQKYRAESGINTGGKYIHKQLVQLLQAEKAAGTWAVQKAWAERLLTFSHAQWKFVVAHEPIYTSNNLANEFTELQTELQPILERTGVSAVFSGHFHTLDISENNNIAYIISGAASQVPYPIGNGTKEALIEYFAANNITSTVAVSDVTPPPIPANSTTRYPTDPPLASPKPPQKSIFTGGNEASLPGFMNARLNNTHLHIDIWGMTNDHVWSIVQQYDTMRIDLKPKKQIGPLKFNIIGDWGVGPNFVASNKDDYGDIHRAANLTLQQYGQLLSMTEQAVQQAFQNVSDKFHPQFVISTGDQFYDDGLFTRTDPQFQNKFTSTFTSVGVQVPWYPCLGNHDYYQNPDAELNRTMDDPRWYFPSKYYNFSYSLEDGSEVLFVVMDVNPALVKYRLEKEIQSTGKYYHKNIVQLLQAAKSTWPAQLAWTEKVLNSSTAKWKIVVGHEPVYSASGDNSFSELQRDVQPILERNNVTVYFGGHYHTLELLQTNNVEYIISGAASQIPFPIGNGTAAALTDYFNNNPVGTTLPPPSTQVPNVTLSNGTAYPVETKPPNGVPAQKAYFVGGNEKWLPGFMTATFVNSSVLHIDVFGMGNDTQWSIVARHDILRRDLRPQPTSSPATTPPPTTQPPTTQPPTTSGSTGNNTNSTATSAPTSTPTPISNITTSSSTGGSSSSTGTVKGSGVMIVPSFGLMMIGMIILALV